MRRASIHEPGFAHPAPLRRRLLWFAALWAGSVLALGAVALVLRLMLKLG